MMLCELDLGVSQAVVRPTAHHALGIGYSLHCFAAHKLFIPPNVTGCNKVRVNLHA